MNVKNGEYDQIELIRNLIPSASLIYSIKSFIIFYINSLLASSIIEMNSFDIIRMHLVQNLHQRGRHHFLEESFPAHGDWVCRRLLR